MKSTTFAVRLIALAWPIAAVLFGCSNDPRQGYSMESPYRPGIRSVAVPMWQVGQAVYRRGLEFRLTEALQKRIMLDTPYKVVSKAKADTELRGSIDEVVQRPLSIDPQTGVAREMEFTLVLSFTWVDLRPGGKTLVNVKNFRVSGTYIPEAPFNETAFQGGEDTINNAAQRIVEQMERPW